MTSHAGLDTFNALLAALATAAATFMFVRIAPRIAWTDGGTSLRKRDVEPLPLVGGAALVVGLLAAWLALELVGRDAVGFVPGRELRNMVARALGPDTTLWPLGGVLTAFVVGTIDDATSDGLRPGMKVLGQALAGCVLGLPLVVAAPLHVEAWGMLALLALGAVVALNAINTYDNADGAASGLGVLALAWPAPMFAASLAAFLPFNMAWGTRRAPRAILGDAGSHVLGMLILITPTAWPALALPLFDLARLVVVRSGLGSAPWVGDRRHLAHRLQGLGLRPTRVALVLAGIALPSVALGEPASALGSPLTLACALAATASLTFAALRRAPAPREIVQVAQPQAASAFAGRSSAAR